MIAHLRMRGWTDAAPTNQERTRYFDAVRCDEGHPVVGRMLVSPEGVRYPAAACNTQHHPQVGKSRALFYLWPPFYNQAYVVP